MAHVIQLAPERRKRLMAEPPVEHAMTLERSLRTYLAVEDALTPWSDSALIAALVTAGPIERGEIIRELEDRARQ